MNHKIYYLILSVLFYFGCVQDQMSYDERMDQCIEERKKAMQVNAIPPRGINCIAGVKIPEFSSEALDGALVSNESLKGKPSIINFWFTTCPPCVAEIPGFNDIKEKYGTESINYIAIGKDNKESLDEFLLDHPWGFTHIYDGGMLCDDVFRIISGYPTTYVLNEDTEIVYTTSGGRVDSLAGQHLMDKLVPVLDGLLQ